MVSATSRIIQTCRADQRLCKVLRLKASGETDVAYHFAPSGRRAPPKSSEAAIKSGKLVPLGDGLFGPDTSQTFAATGSEVGE